MDRQWREECSLRGQVQRVSDVASPLPEVRKSRGLFDRVALRETRWEPQLPERRACTVAAESGLRPQALRGLLVAQLVDRVLGRLPWRL